MIGSSVNPNTLSASYLGLANSVTTVDFGPAPYTPIEAWTATGGGPDSYAGK